MADKACQHRQNIHKLNKVKASSPWPQIHSLPGIYVRQPLTCFSRLNRQRSYLCLRPLHVYSFSSIAIFQSTPKDAAIFANVDVRVVLCRRWYIAYPQSISLLCNSSNGYMPCSRCLSGCGWFQDVHLLPKGGSAYIATYMTGREIRHENREDS